MPYINKVTLHQLYLMKANITVLHTIIITVFGFSGQGGTYQPALTNSESQLVKQYNGFSATAYKILQKVW